MGGHEPTACPSSRCGSAIRWVQTAGGSRVPVDVGRDPAGSLIAARLSAGVWGVRPVTPADDAPGAPALPRYTPHWTTCPDPASWREHARDANTGIPRPRMPPALETALERQRRWLDSITEGPCRRCGGRFPNAYGPGSQPVCDRCSEDIAPPAPRHSRKSETDR